LIDRGPGQTPGPPLGSYEPRASLRSLVGGDRLPLLLEDHPALRAEQDICRFHVTVHYTCPVRRAEPSQDAEADLTDAQANARAVSAALERFGRLDLVVANAGVQHVAPIEEFPLERWQTIVSLLLTSPFLLAKHAWPALRDSGAGRFIAIASVHGLVASPFKAAYVSAKHGLGLVKTLALEVATFGITCNCIWNRPCTVSTPVIGPVAAVVRQTNLQIWCSAPSKWRPM